MQDGLIPKARHSVGPLIPKARHSVGPLLRNAAAGLGRRSGEPAPGADFLILDSIFQSPCSASRSARRQPVPPGGPGLGISERRFGIEGRPQLRERNRR